MQNPRQKNELRPTGRNDRTSRIVYEPRTTYRLETIIALQRALQNGIPESIAAREQDEAACVQTEPVAAKKRPVAQEGVLWSLSTKIRHFVAAALQRRRSCARFRNNVVGLP